MFGCNVKYKNGENKVQIKGKEKNGLKSVKSIEKNSLMN